MHQAALTMRSVEELSLKSPNDTKVYRLCTLDNGLQALLIHDPEINREGQQPAPASRDHQHAVNASAEDSDSMADDDEEGSDEVGHCLSRPAAMATAPLPPSSAN